MGLELRKWSPFRRLGTDPFQRKDHIIEGLGEKMSLHRNICIFMHFKVAQVVVICLKLVFVLKLLFECKKDK